MSAVRQSAPTGAAWRAVAAAPDPCRNRSSPAMNVAVRTVQAIWRHSTSFAELPNEGSMAQLSRPYQIGLVAVALLAAAWLVLVQGHHSDTSGSGSSPAPPATHTATPPAKAHAEGTAGQATGHGSASSLGAFGHDIEKAR